MAATIVIVINNNNNINLDDAADAILTMDAAEGTMKGHTCTAHDWQCLNECRKPMLHTTGSPMYFTCSDIFTRMAGLLKTNNLSCTP